MTPEERTARARKAARARWTLGATEERRVRGYYYYRRVLRALESGNRHWLTREERLYLVNQMSGVLPGGREFLGPRIIPLSNAPAFSDLVTGRDCDDAWSGADALPDAQNDFAWSGADAREHVTRRVTRRITRRIPR